MKAWVGFDSEGPFGRRELVWGRKSRRFSKESSGGRCHSARSPILQAGQTRGFCGEMLWVSSFCLLILLVLLGVHPSHHKL